MSPPERIGPYPVEREVGRGGMGIVYLARDPRLSRNVAIKMLPEAFSRDPERVQRFEREARLLASLTHPNIASIHGIEEENGNRFLVLEYVEGETLAQRIVRGALSADDAAEVCQQIAAALEAAHESGVIHRDLKPGNVKITPAGEVKVLDFGLARGADAGSGVSTSDLSQSPTMAVTATGAGVILGTAAYMSPEQARGKRVDRRTDIWSFGCVLYECLTGRRAFEGETVSDMIALILQGEPDWKALPASTPPRMRALLERCLEKDAKKRLRDIGEARLALEAPHEPVSGVGAVPVAAAPASKRLWIALAAVFAATAAILAWQLLAQPAVDAPVTRLAVLTPEGASQSREPAFISLSPDGRMIAFSCFDSAGPPTLWIRRLDETTARRVPGGDRALIPAWSPDGGSIAFATTEKLMRVDLRGGAPQVLADARTMGRGTAWGSKGVIVFAPGGEGPLYKVSANGGPAEPVTTLDSAQTAHRFPEFLPDGVHFLYAAIPGRGQGFDIFVGSTDGGPHELLMNCDGVPRYAEPGWLVYTRGGRVLAQRFDAARKRLDEPIMRLIDEPTGTDYLGASRVITSREGPLAYQPGGIENTDLVVLDRVGRRLRTIQAPAGRYTSVALSPDQTHLAVVKEISPTEADLWVIDLDRGGAQRLTSGGVKVDEPVWSPDGTQLAYATNASGQWEVAAQSLAGGRERIIKAPSASLKYVTSWSPDGRFLIGYFLSESTGWDLWILPADGSGEPIRYMASSFDELLPRISPDGRWVAYLSMESGRQEVYVQAFPTPGPRYLVSEGGGLAVAWHGSSRRLYYQSATGPVIVELEFDNGVRVTGRRPFLTGTPTDDFRRLLSSKISLDFERTYGSVESGLSHEQNPITIVQNWRSALEPQ
jgi:Tol biopolymer transport system component